MRLVGPCLLLLCLLGACQGTGGDPYALFPEYKGTNLIAGLSLDPADGVWVPDDPSGVHMGFQKMDGVDPPGTAPGSPVCRLEIRNLVPDGDFESSLPGQQPPAGWQATGNGILEIVGPASPHAMTGNAMHFTTTSPAEWVRFDLRNPVNGARDGLPANGSYFARFDYRTSGSGIFFEFDNGLAVTDTWYWGMLGGGPGGVPDDPSWDNRNRFPHLDMGFSPVVLVDGDAGYFYRFGSLMPEKSRSQEGYLDDFRIIRTDIPHSLRLTLIYADTAYPLIPGYYRFSLHVKKDPTAGQGGNRFPTDRVTLGMFRWSVKDGKINSSSRTDVVFVESQTLRFDDWAELAVVMDDSTMDPKDSAISLELSITPSDETREWLHLDCGSILISSPSLEMSPVPFTD